MLSEMVAAGELPPVEERLPEVPFVVGPGVLYLEEDMDWSPGTFGGDMRVVQRDPDWSPEVFVMANEPLVQAPRIGTDNITGNVVESYEVSEDNTVFTFHLREGLRWSDGEYVTTEDVRFTYEDILLNEQITPVFPAKLRSGGSVDGEPMDLTIIDEYTFSVSFDEPYGQFLTVLAIEGWAGYTDLLNPSHHLKQYHIDYTPLEDMREALEEEEFSDEWWNLFNARRSTNWDLTRRSSIDYPALYPWLRVESPSGLAYYERNPYYFKVDTEGQQLPYIDRIVSYEITDHEMIAMGIISGQFDFVAADVRLPDLPMLLENEESGDYDTYLLSQHTVPVAIYLNHTYDDPQWREVMEDVRFRQALSMAIDREEILDTMYFGEAKHPSERIMDPDYSTYNPERAGEYLDAIGMSERDSEGYRLGPHGERFEIRFEIFDRRPDIVPATELYVEYFQDIGIRTSMRMISSALRGQRSGANELQASVDYNHLSLMYLGYYSGDMLPGTWTGWGILWQDWMNTDGREGEEPPAWVREIYALDAEIRRSVPGSEQAQEAWDNVFDWYSTHMPFIYVAEELVQPFMASTRLRNIPHSGINIAAKFTAEQFYFVDGE